MKKLYLSQCLAALVIVAVPVFIGLPILKKAREQSENCSSNLKQIGRALSMYLADSDQVYPPAYEACAIDSNHERFRSWANYLAPYAKAGIAPDAGWSIVNGWALTENAPQNLQAAVSANPSGLWKCPEDLADATLSYGLNPMVSGAYKRWSCATASPEMEWQNSLKLSDVRSPAEIVWCGDTNHLWDSEKKRYTTVFPEWPRNTDIYLRRLSKAQLVQWYKTFLSKDFTDTKGECPYPLAWGCRAPSYRHSRSEDGQRSSSMLYCDGHVQAMPSGTLNVRNIFPDLADADLADDSVSEIHPYRIVNVAAAFHAGAVNNNGVVVGNSNVDVLAFRGDKLTSLRKPNIAHFACGYAVNDAGDIAGNFTSEGEHNHGEEQYGFLWKHGKFQNLQYPDGYDGFMARGINGRAQIAGRAYRGSSASFDGTSRAFLWEKGKFRDLGVPPGCISSSAYAINDAGQVVGSAITRDKHTHAFLWQNGVMRDLGTLPGGTLSAANGINNSGVIVGDSNAAHEDVKRMHPVIWQNGKAMDLGIPPGYKSLVGKAINDKEQVVCNVADVDGVLCGIALWDRKNGMRMVDTLCPKDNGWLLRDVYSINNLGQFVCWGIYGNTQCALALVTPNDVYAKQCVMAGQANL